MVNTTIIACCTIWASLLCPFRLAVMRGVCVSESMVSIMVIAYCTMFAWYLRRLDNNTQNYWPLLVYGDEERTSVEIHFVSFLVARE
jgi:hypothetical protein